MSRCGRNRGGRTGPWFGSPGVCHRTVRCDWARWVQKPLPPAPRWPQPYAWGRYQQKSPRPFATGRIRFPANRIRRTDSTSRVRGRQWIGRSLAGRARPTGNTFPQAAERLRQTAGDANPWLATANRESGRYGAHHRLLSPPWGKSIRQGWICGSSPNQRTVSMARSTAWRSRPGPVAHSLYRNRAPSRL